MKKIIHFRVGTYLLALGLGVVPHFAGAEVQFVMAWGGNVNAIRATPDVCDDAAKCKAGAYGKLQGHFDSPAGVAVDTKGNVYVADQYNHRIQKFDSSGNFKLAWGSNGGLGGQFYNPWGVFVDTNDNVYVADRSNHRIQKFDASGNFKLAWGGNVDISGTTPDICESAPSCQAAATGAQNGWFVFPAGVAVDTNGEVYVVDFGKSRIEKFDASGNFKLAWGSKGGLGGQFVYPASVTVDTDGNVYVIERSFRTENQRVQKFDSSGNFILAWGAGVDTCKTPDVCEDATNCQTGAEGVKGGQFNDPTGITVDKDGNVYVADRSNHRIQKFSFNPN